jgi:hypothetical protein
MGVLHNFFHLDSLRINDQALKFVNWSGFMKGNAASAYDALYKFFKNLAQKLPNPEKWVEGLDQIFNLRELAAHCRKVGDWGTAGKTFNSELLKTTLNRVKELFST